MKPSILTLLSKHQILLSSAIILTFFAGGAFFTSKYFNQKHLAYVAGTCSFPEEIDTQRAQLEGLNSQALGLQTEIDNIQSQIVSNAESLASGIIMVAELQSQILSDYAISEEKAKVDKEQANVASLTTKLAQVEAELLKTKQAQAAATKPSSKNRSIPSKPTQDYTLAIKNLNSQRSTILSSLITARAQRYTALAVYHQILSENEGKKGELLALESQEQSLRENESTLSATFDASSATLASIVNEQMPALEQAISFGEGNLCLESEAGACTDTNENGDPIDNDRDYTEENGYVNCGDPDCYYDYSCQGGGEAEHAGEPDAEDNLGARASPPGPVNTDDSTKRGLEMEKIATCNDIGRLQELQGILYEQYNGLGILIEGSGDPKTQAGMILKRADESEQTSALEDIMLVDARISELEEKCEREVACQDAVSDLQALQSSLSSVNYQIDDAEAAFEQKIAELMYTSELVAREESVAGSEGDTPLQTMLQQVGAEVSEERDNASILNKEKTSLLSEITEASILYAKCLAAM